MDDECSVCGKQMTLVFQFYACDWCDGIVKDEWDKSANNDDTDRIQIDRDFKLKPNLKPFKHKLALPPSYLPASGSLSPIIPHANPFMHDPDDDDDDDFDSTSYYDYSNWNDDD